MIIKPRQLHVILFLLCCLGFLALSFILNKSNHEKYFTKYNPNQRFPARIQPITRDLKLFKDFFKPNTFGSLIDYQLTTDSFALQSDNISEIFTQKIKILTSETFIDQLRDSPDNAKQPVSENIIDLFVRAMMNFSKNYQDESSGFQLDLKFNPIISKEFSFQDEMNTNQLINYAYKNKLYDYIQTSPLPFIQNISQTNIPSNGNTYQYIGGVISLSTKVSEENMLTGKVRFRRYFRVNRLSDLDMKIESKLFNLNFIHFKSNVFQKLPIITVDIIKDINFQNGSQKLKRMDIYFDKIVSSELEENKQKGSQTILTGDLFFKGDTPSTSYKANIHLLSWSFESESFTEESKMTIELIKPRFDMNYGEIKNNIRNNILMKYAPNVIKNLRLARFHKNLGFEQR
jgi:hypothetical protein